ncbi:hypothetical protein ACHAWF_013530 [Thalassiosira exigua]
MPTSFEWTVTGLLPLILTCVAFYLLAGDSVPYFRLWFLYMFLDTAYGHLFHLLLLVPARKIAIHLPGSKVPLDDEGKLSEQEEQSNDPTIVWPSAATVAALPQDWIVPGVSAKETNLIAVRDDVDANAKSSQSSNKKKRSLKNRKPAPSAPKPTKSHRQKATETRQPYCLNHVRGSTRIRQASQRIGAALGTMFSTYLLCSFSPLSFEDVGLEIPSAKRVLFDIVSGLAIGSSIVIFIFLLELRLKWIRITGYFETAVPSEVFAVNFAWDVLFHIGVSINEEVMLRGWMFILGCHGLLHRLADWFEDRSTGAAFAIVASIILQSSLFALLHLHSPGSTRISMINLFIGGIAASVNVMVAGGTLWLGIGWHFGWNIFMGHILGRSTSGIPMSCAVVCVLPRPGYEKYHGGTFGPEQGLLAPLAYILGVAMAIWLYGGEELQTWIDRLVISID